VRFFRCRLAGQESSDTQQPRERFPCGNSSTLTQDHNPLFLQSMKTLSMENLYVFAIQIEFTQRMRTRLRTRTGNFTRPCHRALELSVSAAVRLQRVHDRVHHLRPHCPGGSRHRCRHRFLRNPGDPSTGRAPGSVVLLRVPGRGARHGAFAAGKPLAVSPVRVAVSTIMKLTLGDPLAQSAEAQPFLHLHIAEQTLLQCMS
jgi:hypothetical protein